ncbi:autophagy-related protein 17 [Pilobolus umbonatus]|nr:autophagy-related protein 17 [Pilobolus umbonatus]
MEQELIELLLVAKKALMTGQTICAQANTYCQSSEMYVQTIDKIQPKLQFTNNHIDIQLIALERIKEYLIVQTTNSKTCISNYETQLEVLSIELGGIFDVLKKCTVDKDILAVNKERGHSIVDIADNEEVTLFDYISDQAITEIQRQAYDEIGEIESISAVLDNLIKSISSVISETALLRENAIVISLDEPVSLFSDDKLQIQEDQIARMADILTSLTNHYRQLGEATRLYQSDPEGGEQLNITVLQDDHDHIPSILEDLRDSLDEVKSISDEIKIRYQQYLKIQSGLITVLNQLEYFGSFQGDIICEKIVDTDQDVKKHETNLEDHFKQLASLAEWYRFYSSSYHYLLLEIERRKKVEEKQEALRRELMRTFEDTYNDEVQQRREWSLQHGEYLPEVLCPFIKDAPPRLVIHVQSDTGRLPNVSKET